MEIEVLRADEASEGITAGANGPVARGTDVAVVARAWVEPAEGAAHAERRPATCGRRSPSRSTPRGWAPTDPRAAVFHRADARRAAARRLGRKLAARVLGMPSASEDTQ